MIISGALFVEHAVVQPFTDYIWLEIHPSNNSSLHFVARVFLALRRSLRSLDKFYDNSNIPINPTTSNVGCLFRHVLSYKAANSLDIRFEYVITFVEHDPTKPIFKAKTVDGNMIVVKFIQKYKYNYRLLAGSKHPPWLLCPETVTDDNSTHGCVGALKMMVMELIDGELMMYIVGHLCLTICSKTSGKLYVHCMRIDSFSGLSLTQHHDLK
jgi:hypothetical protein